MIKGRKRLIIVLIASMLGIGAGVAASGIAVRNPESADAKEAGASEVQQPVPEALLPPIAAGGGSYRM